MPLTRLTPLAALTYALLIVYACLYPLSGWQRPATDLLAFVSLTPPRYYTGIDIGLNIAGYVPLGLLLALAQPLGRHPVMRVGLAVGLAAMLSFALEFGQNYLPSRVASNLDLAANTLGALLGALAGSVMVRTRWWRDTRHAMFVEGLAGASGRILLALWLLSQLMPTRALIAGGDLRLWIELPTLSGMGESDLALLRAVQTLVAVLAVGLVCRAMLRGRARSWLPPMLIVAGVAASELAMLSARLSTQPFGWQPATLWIGLAAGLLLLLSSRRLEHRQQLWIGVFALVANVVAIHLLPFATSETLSASTRGNPHLFSFFGLTTTVAALWPYLALVWLAGNWPRLAKLAGVNSLDFR